MNNLSFYFQNWLLPMLAVGIIYAIFLIPVYLWAKKKKLSYWKVNIIAIVLIFLIDFLFLVLAFLTKFNYLILDLLFFSFLVNCVFFLIIPVLVKKNIKDVSAVKVAITYLAVFILQCFYGVGLLYLIAWGASFIAN